MIQRWPGTVIKPGPDITWDKDKCIWLDDFLTNQYPSIPCLVEVSRKKMNVKISSHKCAVIWIRILKIPSKKRTKLALDWHYYTFWRSVDMHGIMSTARFHLVILMHFTVTVRMFVDCGMNMHRMEILSYATKCFHFHIKCESKDSHLPQYENKGDDKKQCSKNRQQNDPPSNRLFLSFCYGNWWTDVNVYLHKKKWVLTGIQSLWVCGTIW